MRTLSDDAARFHNRLRILLNIEEHELITVGAGVDPITFRVRADFMEQFMANPFRTFIRADDATAAAIWSIVEAREAKRSA
jgi:hypothetical protein